VREKPRTRRRSHDAFDGGIVVSKNDRGAERLQRAIQSLRSKSVLASPDHESFVRTRRRRKRVNWRSIGRHVRLNGGAAVRRDEADFESEVILRFEDHGPARDEEPAEGRRRRHTSFEAAGRKARDEGLSLRVNRDNLARAVGARITRGKEMRVSIGLERHSAACRHRDLPYSGRSAIRRDLSEERAALIRIGDEKPGGGGCDVRSFRRAEVGRRHAQRRAGRIDGRAVQIVDGEPDRIARQAVERHARCPLRAECAPATGGDTGTGGPSSVANDDREASKGRRFARKPERGLMQGIRARTTARPSFSRSQANGSMRW